MKKIITLLFAFFLAGSSTAQNFSAYFMEGSLFRSRLNPAFAPRRGYVNIPVVGGVSISTGGNLSVDRLFYPVDGALVTLASSAVSAQTALQGLESRNRLGTDARVDLFGIGAYRADRKTFWSFDLSARVNADMLAPYELFSFLKQGGDVDVMGLGFASEGFLEAGFNYSFPIGEKLRIGARLKALMGIARARADFDHLRMTMDADRWQVNARGTLDVWAAGLDLNTEAENGDDVYGVGDISLRPLAPAGYGAAIDFGASYDILPGLQASLAVNDLGFISWGAAYNQTGAMDKEMTFTGITIDSEGTRQPDFNFNELKFRRREPQGATHMLRASLLAGAEYNLWQHKVGFGLLYTVRFWEYQTLHRMTGSVNYRPVSWCGLTASYSVIGNRGGTLGLAVNFCPKWIHFYLATDLLVARHTPQFLPVGATEMNLTVGIGIPFGRVGIRAGQE